MKDLEKVLKASADKNRLRILKLLQKRRMCVCELAFVLKIAGPSISRHLRKLKSAGLINEEQDGFWTNYYIDAGKNPYASKLMKDLKLWINDDELVKKDSERAKKADRQKECCKR